MVDGVATTVFTALLLFLSGNAAIAREDSSLTVSAVREESCFYFFGGGSLSSLSLLSPSSLVADFGDFFSLTMSEATSSSERLSEG